MQFTISIILTIDYYKEFYNEWLKHRSKKKWQPLIAVVLIIFGVVMYIRHSGIIPLFFIGFGIYEMFEFYYSKKKWLKERLNSNVKDKQITLTFNEKNIHHSGPNSIGEIEYSGIQKVVETEKGLFLIPESGTSMYIPVSVLESDDQKNFIIEKINKNKVENAG